MKINSDFKFKVFNKLPGLKWLASKKSGDLSKKKFNGGFGGKLIDRFKRSQILFEMFFPKAIGVAFSGDDLSVTMVCKKSFKCVHETIRTTGFLSKDLSEVEVGIKHFKQTVNEVVLSIPRQKVHIREIDYPGSDLMELKEALNYQLDSFLPFTSDEAYYDVYKVGNSEQNQKILIIAIRKNDLDVIIAKLETIGIVPTKVLITPISLTAIIGERKGKIVTIHKWEDDYCYNTFSDGLFTSTVVIKDKDLLLKQIRVDMPDEILESDRLFLSKENAAEVISNKDMDNQEDGNDEMASNYKSIPISSIDDSQESFGAALYGIEKAGNGFSLLNTGRKGKHLQKRLMFGFLGLLVLFMFFLPHVTKNRKLKALNIINDRIRVLKKGSFKIEDIQSRLTEMEDTLMSVGKIRAKYVPKIKVLLELSEKLPKDAWVKELYIYRNSFEISGTAKSATDLIPTLENSLLFSNVGFTAVINTVEGKETFRLKGQINVVDK
ncbi:MAG: PilN domain-containing protein [Candidatus Anammoxibacter sp.]